MHFALLSLLLGCPAAAVRHPAALVACHDGDTCRFNIRLNEQESDLGLGVWQTIRTELRDQAMRFCDIDAPELATPAGAPAREALAGWLGQARVLEVALTGGRDKYGRLLGWVYTDGACVNDRLVKGGYAKVYRLLCAPPRI